MDKDFKRVLELTKEIKAIIDNYPNILSVSISRSGEGTYIYTFDKVQSLKYESKETKHPNYTLEVCDLGDGVVTNTLCPKNVKVLEVL